MKSPILISLEQLLENCQIQTIYSHQIPTQNQIHSQLLNYYGLNRFGTGKWIWISSTHFSLSHQTADYKLINQQRSYKIHTYTLKRDRQTEDFIQKLAAQDAVFAQQLEQLGTPLSSTHHRHEHLLDLIDTFCHDLFSQLSISDQQKAKVKATRANACFACWKPGVFIGIAPQALNTPAGKDPADALVIGVWHTFAPYSNWVSERDLSDFFDGYTINSQPAFALSLPLLPFQYQLWKQLLPDWFYSRQNTCFHFYNHALSTRIISQSILHILDKTITFNYSLDRVERQKNKHISEIQQINSRISSLTWSDGSTDTNVYLVQDPALTFDFNALQQFHTKHSLATN